MRVTERSRVGSMLLAQGRAAQRLDKATRVAVSGQRVQKPSDDPAAYGSKIRRDYTMAMLEEHSKNAIRTFNELDVVQGNLAAGIDIMVRVKEAAVNGANATTDGNARKLLAEDVRTMRDELISIGNTRYGEKYLFAGTKTDTIPFDVVTGNFNGNDQIVRVPVLEGVAPATNINGALAFTSIGGGRNIFQDLNDLATALDNNDQVGVQNMLDNLAKGHEQLVRAQSDAGFSSERFRNALEVLTTTKTAVAERLSSEIEGDPAQQISELQLARTAYEQTIAVTKQLLQMTSVT